MSCWKGILLMECGRKFLCLIFIRLSLVPSRTRFHKRNTRFHEENALTCPQLWGVKPSILLIISGIDKEFANTPKGSTILLETHEVFGNKKDIVEVGKLTQKDKPWSMGSSPVQSATFEYVKLVVALEYANAQNQGNPSKGLPQRQFAVQTPWLTRLQGEKISNL